MRTLVQKIALWIIQGNSKESYENRLEKLEIERLSTRRQKLCLKFASKTVKSRHSEMFPKRDDTGYNTRQVFGPYCELRSFTNRCYNSPLNFLTRLLNENFLRSWCWLSLYLCYCWTMDDSIHQANNAHFVVFACRMFHLTNF